MKVSHLVYKVDNLTSGVKSFEDKGFKVEYGAKTNPHNALIYFSEGPYIELLEHAPLTASIKMLLKIAGKQKVVERLAGWGTAKEGPIDLCLENYEPDLSKEAAILKKFKQPYFRTKSKRLDPQDRLLKWKLLFPYELRLPFLMTYFNIDPKPKNFIHPNGVKRIKHISFGMEARLIPIIKALCEDELLDVQVGHGIKEFVYEKN